MRIDAHQHFWNYDPIQYPWIENDWPIRRDFLPAHLEPELRNFGFDGCIAVQARQSLEETRWLLDLARSSGIIKGVVGWVDLRSELLVKQLESFENDRKLVGVRHVVQDEPDDDFMLGQEFVRGIGELKRFELVYDILIYPRQLPAAIGLVRMFPEQTFVLDHMAKPEIKNGVFEPWATQIAELARCPNVYCKASGLVTEARWQQWKAEDFQPYLEAVWSAFGPDRLMVGSDWPVCLNSADYRSTMKLSRDFFSRFSVEDQSKVLGLNAARAYGLF